MSLPHINKIKPKKTSQSSGLANAILGTNTIIFSNEVIHSVHLLLIIKVIYIIGNGYLSQRSCKKAFLSAAVSVWCLVLGHGRGRVHQKPSVKRRSFRIVSQGKIHCCYKLLLL